MGRMPIERMKAGLVESPRRRSAARIETAKPTPTQTPPPPRGRRAAGARRSCEKSDPARLARFIDDTILIAPATRQAQFVIMRPVGRVYFIRRRVKRKPVTFMRLSPARRRIRSRASQPKHPDPGTSL